MLGFVYLSLAHKMGTDILRETGVELVSLRNWWSSGVE